MVGKGKSISHGKNAIDYARNKENAEELCRSDTIMGETGTEIANEFKIYQNMNENCRKNTLTVVLSPDPKDGKRLTQEDFKQITQDYLKDMKLDKHQYIAYTHKDREHTHVHLFVNRINNQGIAYKDSFIGKRSQEVADKIAQERELIRAKEVGLQRANNHKELRQGIFSKHQEVLKENPKSFQEYIQKMERQGIQVNPTINNKGEIQGFRVEAEGKSFKASEVHRTMSYNKIKLNFEKDKNFGISKEKLEVLKNHRLTMKHNPNFPQYQKTMQKKGYHVSNLMNQGGNQAKNFIIVANQTIVQGKVHMTKEEYQNHQKEAELQQEIHIQIHLEHIENFHQEGIEQNTENEKQEIMLEEAEKSKKTDNTLDNRREIEY